MKSFTERYKPESVGEIPQPVKDMQLLVEQGEHVLLYGPPGCGKTTAVYAIAKAGDYEIVEFNASDVRNKAQVESVILSAATQQSLFGAKKLILVDEVDGLSGMDDRGGAVALARVLELAKHPMVLVANDLDSEKLKDIKRRTTLVEFSSVKTGDLVNILDRVCRAEGIAADESAVRRIVVNANGDIRAALNDVQANCVGQRLVVEGMTPREYETDIVQALNNIFKTRGVACARVFDNLNVDLDEFVLWLDENLPFEYTDVDDVARAYEKMSLADVFQGRIRRWQYWRFLVYRSMLLSAGVSLAKEQPYRSVIKYKRTMRLLKIWQANMRNVKKKAIGEKLARYTHQSKRRVVWSFGLYAWLFSEELTRELKLNEEETAYINELQAFQNSQA